MKRFWDKVEKTGSCWLWTGARVSRGYGSFKLNTHQSIGAHRYSYFLAHGKVSDDLVIMHKCDNPPCVNPDHLTAGTQIENIVDAMRKRRWAVGRRKPQAKLSDSDVMLIRKLSADGMPKAQIARWFGTSATCVSLAVRGITWKHVS